MKRHEHHCQYSVALYGATFSKRPQALSVSDMQRQVAASRRLLPAE